MHFEICKIHTVFSYTSMQVKIFIENMGSGIGFETYSDMKRNSFRELLYIIMKYI